MKFILNILILFNKTVKKFNNKIILTKNQDKKNNLISTLWKFYKNYLNLKFSNKIYKATIIFKKTKKCSLMKKFSTKKIKTTYFFIKFSNKKIVKRNQMK